MRDDHHGRRSASTIVDPYNHSCLVSLIDGIKSWGVVNKKMDSPSRFRDASVETGISRIGKTARFRAIEASTRTKLIIADHICQRVVPRRHTNCGLHLGSWRSPCPALNACPPRSAVLRWPPPARHESGRRQIPSDEVPVSMKRPRDQVGDETWVVRRPRSQGTQLPRSSRATSRHGPCSLENVEPRNPASKVIEGYQPPRSPAPLRTWSQGTQLPRSSRATSRHGPLLP